MNRVKMLIAKRFFKELLPLSDASTGGGTNRELASEVVKPVTFKENNESDFESAEYSLEDIQTAYNIDSYIRQGVDKYIDQIFKEGYTFSGTDEGVTDYIKLRFEYIAEGTDTPTNQLLIDIAEDLVKYGNAMVVKVRSNDQNALPEGTNLQGLYGKDPVVGYFCANPVHMKCKRDKNGVIQKWQQDNDAGKQEFDPKDVIHFYYKREKGYAYGTSFLVPVLPDVQALRRAEENVLKMMYRHIYPFYHVMVGTEEATGTTAEVNALQEEINGLDVEGGLITTERVTIKPIALDKVINAEPYLQYMEARVFSGLGIPAIMFGRGNTTNRSTGDNMTSEMADRIRAIQKIIMMFFNHFMVKELLMEAGYDPVLNPDQAVEFRFNDNDVDVEIKKQVHSIYKYEHNAITENEMRSELGMDPVADADREMMFVELITRQNLKLQGEIAAQNETGSSETNNKEKNQGGKKQGNSGNKKNSDKLRPLTVGIIKDTIDNTENVIDNYIRNCKNSGCQIIPEAILKYISDCHDQISFIVSRDNKNIHINDDYMSLFDDICKDVQNIEDMDMGKFSDILNLRVSVYKNNVLRNFI